MIAHRRVANGNRRRGLFYSSLFPTLLRRFHLFLADPYRRAVRSLENPEKDYKPFNIWRLDYHEVLDKLKELEEEKNEITQAENAAYEKWTREKETVLKIWEELNTQIKITNPRNYYK